MKEQTIEKGKKEQIIKIAQELFARFGFAKTTIEDIARSLRMAKASIYYYFKNKEAIYEEVIKKEGRITKDEIMKAVSEQETPQEKLKAYILTRFRAFKKMANYYTAFKEEYLKNYSFVIEARNRYREFELNLIKNILNYGIKRGEFEIEDVDLTAEAILTAMNGFEYQFTFDTPEEELERNLDTLLNVLFRGIEKRKG